MTCINPKGAVTGELEAEVDLDTSPILNVLIILIPFLASVAVYTRFSMLDVSLPPNLGPGLGGSAEKPKIKLTLVLNPGFIALTSGETLLDSLPRAGADFNFTAVRERLAARRAAAEVQDEVVVAVKDPVTFQYVVRAMDACRQAGFAKIGLAGATEDPTKGQ